MGSCRRAGDSKTILGSTQNIVVLCFQIGAFFSKSIDSRGHHASADTLLPTLFDPSIEDQETESY